MPHSPFIEFEFDYGENSMPRFITALVRKKHVRSISNASNGIWVSLTRSDGKPEGCHVRGVYEDLKAKLEQ